MKKYKNYFEDLIKINNQLKFLIGFKTKEAISKYTNTLDDDYMNKLKELIKKYSETDDIELQLEINFIKKYLELNIYLCFLISSYVNEIINFEYENNHIYPKKYKKERLRDFNNYVKTIKLNLEKSLKLNITIPYIICKKFLNQIKSIKKYNYLYNYIKNYYIKKCRKTIGIYDLPNGNEIYKELIIYNIGINKTPEEIHKLGLSLIPKNKEIKKKNGYNTKEELLNDCKRYAKYIYENIIDKYFYYKPDKEFNIKKLPKILEKSSPLAFYNEFTDIVYINMLYYKECDKNTLYSLIMHECFHQYHFRFLKYYKLEKYKIYGYNNIALIEGFAHYMEIYCDNYDDNNEYSLLRKIRLVADTGINYYKWSYKKTYNYMLKYMPHNKNDIKNEIERYICMPSQALAYTFGKLEILKLRDEYLSKNKGTIKDFHHILLINGNVSFIYLNKIIK